MWPPPEVVARLAALARPTVEGVRWTTPEQWHVTLRFLGWVDDVLEPSETRRKVVAGFRVLRSKREELPQRKHGNVPL